MAIVKMNRISIIGLNSIKSSLIKELMDSGVVEISAQDSKLSDQDWMPYIKKDGNENEVSNYDVRISRINEVLNSIEKYDVRKKPLFVTRKSISSKEYEAALLNNDKAEENVAIVLKLNKSLCEFVSEENKIQTAILSLNPWKGYEMPLELSDTRYTSILTGVVPTIADIEKLKVDLDKKTDNYFMNIVGSDKDQHYISIICLTKEKEEVNDILKQYGFNLVLFKNLTGTTVENIAQYENKLKDIAVKKETIEKSIAEYVKFKEEMQLFHDHLVIERDKKKILSNMLKTETTFYIAGWIPEESKEQVLLILNKHQCWYEITVPEKGEETPIAIKNNSFSQPFESVTELYSLPSASNIDATPFMAPFYFIFFGLMLADVGYGIIMSVVCFVVLKKFAIEGTLRKMLNMFFYCGLSTIFWGVMFGSWFGDAFTAIAKVMFHTDFVIKPIWINPIEEPMVLLIASFIFGIIHLFFGMGLKAYMLIRDGYALDALFDIGFWYGFIIGIAMWLFGNTIMLGLGLIGKWMTIVFALGLVLTQGRSKKGIFSRLLSGVLSLYNVTSYLSDVLSYSRLLALGLATGVISSVISVLGSLGGDGIFGSILLIVVMIFGHTFNFAINGLGTFVHAARLQYVEFFGKFYEGGGDAFNPFTKKTKYIKIN
ncbi:MAG: V-type ATP synthase subunit I [Sedimentibacter sp.]|uniref:V-type ATP synthase subunit I n=1 Tax=Sedimentibacter sp. TaxID=1960295 RepID=UPI0029816A1A|nr:V-type ATP synthase subunit I [Sedimentibacter sp.]MDW5299744.1 V-type ATP synthase subunit I [Sedimentibacter sp.]